MTEIRRIFRHCNSANPESSNADAQVVEVLEKAGIEIMDSLEDPGGPADAMILLGGDGFLMESLRRFDYPNLPVFGINFGTVGFLMNSHTCIPHLPTILRDHRFAIVPHHLLLATAVLEGGDQCDCFAFNDFVLERQTGQSVRLKVSVDGVLFNHFAGDGFVISTAAGSTAYNLAAGGPAVHPSVQAIVLTPLYPHQAEPFHSVQFSLALPLDCVISVSTEDLPKRHMRLVADGQPVRNVSEVRIMDSGKCVRLLRTYDREFVRLLSEKFIGQRINNPET